MSLRPLTFSFPPCHAMTTAAEPLLSELCKIWFVLKSPIHCIFSSRERVLTLPSSHTNPPKYRCPRCSVQTCSLPCTKRHKLWAQCSGVRDPAAYIKRNDLATPAGIDRDYNFLTRIEREIEGAEKDAVARGVQLADDADGRSLRAFRPGPQKGEVNVQKAIERTGVIVDRAPKGMVRSRENKTHWHKKYVTTKLDLWDRLVLRSLLQTQVFVLDSRVGV